MTLVFESGLILFPLVLISSLLFEMSDSIPWDVSSYLRFYRSGTTILPVVTILFIELFLGSSHELAVFHVLSQFFQYYTNRYKRWNARDKDSFPRGYTMSKWYLWTLIIPKQGTKTLCVPCTWCHAPLLMGSLRLGAFTLATQFAVRCFLFPQWLISSFLWN